MDRDIRAIRDAVNSGQPPPPAAPRAQRLIFPDSSSGDDDDASAENGNKGQRGPIVVDVQPEYNWSTNEEDHVDPLLFVGDRDGDGDDEDGFGWREDTSAAAGGEHPRLPLRRGRYEPPTTAQLQAAEREERELREQMLASASAVQQRGAESSGDDGDGSGVGDSVRVEEQQQQPAQEQQRQAPRWQCLMTNRDGYTFDINPESFYQQPASSRDEILSDRLQRNKTWVDGNAPVVPTNTHLIRRKKQGDGDAENDDDSSDENDEDDPFTAAARNARAQQFVEAPAPPAALPSFPKAPQGVFGLGSGLPSGIGEIADQLAAASERERAAAFAAHDDEGDDCGDDEDEEEGIEEELDEMLLVEAVRRMVAVCLEQLEDVAGSSSSSSSNVSGDDNDEDASARGDGTSNTNNAREKQPKQPQASTNDVVALDVIALNEHAASGRAHRASFRKFVAVCQPLLRALEENKMTLDEFVDETSGPMFEIHKVLRKWSRPPKPPNVVVDGKVCDM